MNIIGKIAKTDEHLVFGWASVATDASGQVVVDSEGDTIPIEELERAAYDFVLHSRQGGEMHTSTGGATLVESMVFTPEKLKLFGVEGIPHGWWVGFKVTDETLWDKIKSGAYPMFSIGGRADREVTDDDNA